MNEYTIGVYLLNSRYCTTPICRSKDGFCGVNRIPKGLLKFIASCIVNRTVRFTSINDTRVFVVYPTNFLMAVFKKCGEDVTTTTTAELLDSARFGWRVPSKGLNIAAIVDKNGILGWVGGRAPVVEARSRKPGSVGHVLIAIAVGEIRFCHRI